MTSDHCKLIDSWIESDRYYVYRFRLSNCSKVLQARFRIGDDRLIEEVQVSEVSPEMPPAIMVELLNDAIREYNNQL